MANRKMSIAIRYGFMLLFFAGFFLHTDKLSAQEKIVAVVNNDIITQKDLNDFMNFMRMQMNGSGNGRELENKISSMKTDLLNKLIEDRLIISEAKKSSLRIDDNRIKAKIGEIRKRYASELEFQESLKKQGMVQADLEAKIREQLLMYSIIDFKVRSKITVSPLEVTEYYQKHAEEFKSPQVLEFDALTLEDKIKAEEISSEIKNGKSFEEVAAKFSLTINKLNMKKGESKKDVEDVVSKLSPQGVTEPVKIEDKYYIFKLVNITASRQQNLSESQENIHTFLYNKKMQEGLANWLDEIKQRSYIKIMQN